MERLSEKLDRILAQIDGPLQASFVSANDAFPLLHRGARTTPPHTAHHDGRPEAWSWSGNAADPRARRRS